MFFSKDNWIDGEIDRVAREMTTHEVLSDEWSSCAERFQTLNELRHGRRTVSRDTLVAAGTNLLGIFMIVKHEHLNVITSKAVGLLFKPKI